MSLLPKFTPKKDDLKSIRARLAKAAGAPADLAPAVWDTGFTADPPKPAPLSAVMMKAILAAHGGGESRLYRWPGGFWMPRARREQERDVLEVSAGTQTVRALIERGMLREVAHMSRGDPWIVETTEAALALIAGQNTV